jgi:hypothetical protein
MVPTPDVSSLSFTSGINPSNGSPYLDFKVVLSEKFSKAQTLSLLYWAIGDSQTWIVLPRDPLTGIFSARIDLSRYAKSGDYGIRDISVSDNTGVRVSFNEYQLSELGYKINTNFTNPNADNTAPNLVSVITSNYYFGADGTVHIPIKIKASDIGSGLKPNFIVEFFSPSGASLQQWVTFDKSNNADFDFILSKYASNGDYKINTIRLEDYAGNEQMSHSWLADHPINVPIQNPNADFSSPLLKSFTPSVSFDSNTQRPIINLSGDITETGSGLSGVYVRMYSPTGVMIDAPWLGFSSTGYDNYTFYGTKALTTEYIPGEYSIQWIILKDNAGNETNYYPLVDNKNAITNKIRVYFPAGSLSINGITTQAQTLTATNNLSDTDGMGTISYQWQADGSNISGATGSSLLLGQAQVGKVIGVVASYTDGFGTAKSVSSSCTDKVSNINDLPSGAVSITGTVTKGQTLTASNNLADSDGLGVISYQWLRSGYTIPGANQSSYTLTSNDVNAKISVKASYTDGFGTQETATSPSTALVTSPNNAPKGSVSITGTSAQGQTLTASNTLADADGLGTISYQWQADGSNISGATSSSLLLSQAQVGKVITVVASYTDGQGTSEKVSSASTAKVANINDAPIGTVSISGAVTQGEALTASNNLADVDGLGVISYQWQVDGSNISGATGSSLLLGQAQVGKAIGVIASYTDGQGTSEKVSSSPTAKVANINDAPTGVVSISGTTIQGQTLTAYNTLADVDGLGVISYQWQADGSNISGATGNTFVLGQSQVGKVIGVVASYTDGQGTVEKVSSSTSAKVTNINDAPTGAVTFSGSGLQGEALNAINSIADLDGLGSITYQWMRSGVAINGANAKTYVVSAQDKGESLSVRASYIDGGNTAETVSSTVSFFVLPLPEVTITASNVKGVISGTTDNDVFDTTLNTTAKYQGGKGDDSYTVNASGVVITESANQGIDTVFSGASFTLPLNVENLKLFGLNDIAATGNKSNNLIVGNSANNLISGLEGNDTLTGGAGKDTFVFSTAPNAKTNVDTITDFNPGEDLIGLKASIFKKLGVGVETSELWLKNQGSVQTAKQYLVYDSNSGTLSYDADGNGKGVAIPVAIIGTNLSLVVGDFVLI